MFQVLDNDRPADCNWHECSADFGNSTFNSFQKALNYAYKWLGYRPTVCLKINIPFDYSGYGSYIEIRKLS